MNKKTEKQEECDLCNLGPIELADLLFFITASKYIENGDKLTPCELNTLVHTAIDLEEYFKRK